VRGWVRFDLKRRYRDMKKLTWGLLVIAAVVAIGCASGIKTYTESDPDYREFSTLKTFGKMELVDDPEFPMWALEHTQYMTDRILKHKGFKESDTPDFLITAHGAKSRFIDSTNFGYDDGWGVNAASFNRQEYVWLGTEGSIMIDIVDAKTNRLIWHSSSPIETRAQVTQGQIKQMIERAVAKMLEEFPPKEGRTRLEN
jgi:hypothetical protein